MTKLIPFNEITAAILIPKLNNNQMNEFTANAKEFLKSYLDIDVQHDIIVVENTNSDVAIALPYYENMQTITASSINEEELDEIIGGEILISIFAIAGTAIGFGIASSAAFSATFTGACVAATVCGVTGGLIGTAVVGSSVAAGVQGIDDKNIDGSKK